MKPDWWSAGQKRFPGRVRGYCYVNPGWGREAVEEVRRCIEGRGFMGIKLYNEYTCNEPVVYPIVELAIEQAKVAVDLGCGAFDGRHRPDEGLARL